MPDEVINETEQEAPQKTPKDIVIETFKALDSWETEWEPIIDFQDEHFLLYYGDIENTFNEEEEGGDGSTYFLLETYLKIPYTFNPGGCKLYRGIINEFEANQDNYRWSGFVHYSGCMDSGSFCYGDSGVSTLLHHMSFAIQDESKLEPDNLDYLYVLFKNYLSQSSHGSMRDYGYRKLDMPETISERTYEVIRWINYDGHLLPSVFYEIRHVTGFKGIDYTKPFVRVVHEDTAREFHFKGRTIIPRVVEHEYIIDKVERKTLKYLPISKIRKYERQKTREKARAYLTDYPKPTLYNYFLKLPNKLSRVDGGIYI